MISGLLEGAAFLAARVQLKLKHEFHEFTSNLLERARPELSRHLPRRHCSPRSYRLIPIRRCVRECRWREAPISMPPIASATAASPVATG